MVRSHIARALRFVVVAWCWIVTLEVLRVVARWIELRPPVHVEPTPTVSLVLQALLASDDARREQAREQFAREAPILKTRIAKAEAEAARMEAELELARKHEEEMPARMHAQQTTDERAAWIARAS